MKQHWSLWESELKDEEIAHIIEHCEKFPVEEAKVYPMDGGDGEVQKDVRRSEVRFITDQYCSELVWQYVKRANTTCYGFDIENSGFAMQYTAYHGSNEGHYDWHQDTDLITDGFEDRKLSIVIQLSDPEKYEGGDFQFELNGDAVTIPEFRKKGSILVFPSFLKHRVQNVTKGKRNSLVSWVMGPNFK